jgi:hypothetical protein
VQRAWNRSVADLSYGPDKPEYAALFSPFIVFLFLAIDSDLRITTIKSSISVSCIGPTVAD